MVELVQAGRTPAQLARGRDVLSSAEREDLTRLRRQVRQLQTEHDILAKATAWFAAEGEKTSGGPTNS